MTFYLHCSIIWTLSEWEIEIRVCTYFGLCHCVELNYNSNRIYRNKINKIVARRESECNYFINRSSRNPISILYNVVMELIARVICIAVQLQKLLRWSDNMKISNIITLIFFDIKRIFGKCYRQNYWIENKCLKIL